MSYFMVPLSILGLALPWAMLSDVMGVDERVWQVKCSYYIRSAYYRPVYLYVCVYILYEPWSQGNVTFYFCVFFYLLNFGWEP